MTSPSRLALLVLLALPAASPAQDFDTLSRAAAQARDAGRLAEADRLYTQALAAKPAWDEGWWYLGALRYETGRYEEAQEPLRRFLALKPDSPPALALLGLSAYGSKRYGEARDLLARALAAGSVGNEELTRAARFTFAVSATKTGLFEWGLESLMVLATARGRSPELLDAIGLNLLRKELLPSEVQEPQRDLVRRAGEAGFLQFTLSTQDPEPLFGALAQAYPAEPWVHYLHGVVLRRSDGAAALRAFNRELEIQPDNVLAHLQLAFDLLEAGDAKAARPHAEKAAALAPGLFAARHALGRVLLEEGRLGDGVRELEEASRLAPDSAPTQLALAQAYARQGRAEEAARARRRFEELQRSQKSRQLLASPMPPPEGGAQP